MTHSLDAAIARLDDYARAHDTEEAARDYEEDLFARALSGDAPELRFRSSLTTTLKQMSARGSISLWLTAAEVAAAQASGLRAFVFDLDPANPKPAEIPPEADLFITRVRLDLKGVQTLDVEVLAEDGTVLKRMPDIAFDGAEGVIYACCEADLARLAASKRTLTRLWATYEDGRRLLGELHTT